MAEIRRLSFDTFYDNETHGFRLVKMASKDEKHIATITRVSDGTFEVRCSCDNGWRHGEKTSEDTMLDIFNAHLCYFDRPKLKVD